MGWNIGNIFRVLLWLKDFCWTQVNIGCPQEKFIRVNVVVLTIKWLYFNTSWKLRVQNQMMKHVVFLSISILYSLLLWKKGPDHSITVTETDHTLTPLGKIICGFITEMGKPNNQGFCLTETMIPPITVCTFAFDTVVRIPRPEKSHSD